MASLEMYLTFKIAHFMENVHEMINLEGDSGVEGSGREMVFESKSTPFQSR